MTGNDKRYLAVARVAGSRWIHGVNSATQRPGAALTATNPSRSYGQSSQSKNWAAVGF